MAATETQNQSLPSSRYGDGPVKCWPWRGVGLRTGATKYLKCAWMLKYATSTRTDPHFKTCTNRFTSELLREHAFVTLQKHTNKNLDKGVNNWTLTLDGFSTQKKMILGFSGPPSCQPLLAANHGGSNWKGLKLAKAGPNLVEFKMCG